MQISLIRSLSWALILALSSQAQEPDKLRDANKEVPFELKNGFLIEFEGSIGIMNGLKFILDTGATRSVVDRALAKKMGIRLYPKRLFDFDRWVEASEAAFPVIKFGPIELTDIPMLVGDLSDFSVFAKGADVVIGSDLLALCGFSIDYDEKTLTFHLPEHPASSPGPHPVGMVLRLQAQEHHVDLLVDTGTEGIVLFEDRLLAQFPRMILQDEVRGIMIGRWSHARQVSIPHVYLGSKAIEAKPLLVKGPPGNILPGIDGYLGTSALRPHRIEFDIARNSFKWQ